MRFLGQAAQLDPGHVALGAGRDIASVALDTARNRVGVGITRAGQKQVVRQTSNTGAVAVARAAGVEGDTCIDQRDFRRMHVEHASAVVRAPTIDLGPRKRDARRKRGGRKRAFRPSEAAGWPIAH
jgi:hypothetical protein